MFGGRIIVVGLALLLSARSVGAQSTRAEARAYHYADSSGLVVGTYGASLRQALPAAITVEAKAVADHVSLDPGRGFDPSNPTADRSAPDAVTSASASAGRGSVASEWRFEGQLGGDIGGVVGGAPASAGLVGRASTEPDYRSLAVAARAAVELFERNTSLAVVAGYGHDEIRPVEVLGGQEALWPATHDRIAASLAFSQLLSPRLVLLAGLGATWQRGTLSSPYRRAVVHPNLLLPEVLPDERDRYTGLLGLALSLAPVTALHLRLGGYADSWGVRAFIPQLSLAHELAPGLLVEGGYRFYRQRAAPLYQATYDTVRPIMAGDPRLGAISDHTIAFDLRYPLRAGGRLTLPLLAGYQLSRLTYRGPGARVIAHVFSLGIEAVY